ncbi:MAG: HD domain-containing protein [Bacilli bacterium]|nr:HD domain-containing protein [Bacilli bacterium]
MDEDRLKHSYAVAKKMIELGKNEGLSEEELQELFLLGYLHDIGYQFGANENHNIIGGNLLKENDYKYWKEVYYHGVPNSEYQSMYLSILNAADMMIDKYGNDISFDKRIEDIKNRYGEESVQYINCLKIINDLKKQF